VHFSLSPPERDLFVSRKLFRPRIAFVSLAVLAVAAAGCAVPPPAKPAATPPTSVRPAVYQAVEAQLVDAINDQRAANGLPALALHAELITKARAWAAAMASGACGLNANNAPKVCHSKLSDGITAKWNTLGENVSTATPRSNIAGIIKGFAAKNQHNNLGAAFDRVGAGVAYRNNKVYVAEVFMDSQTTPAATTPTTKATPPASTTPTTRAPQPTGNEIRFANAYTTSYNWWDNNPPQSSAICCKALHNEAAGNGTYADPITVAVDYKSGSTMEFAPGTRFYVPRLRAYFIVEDRTGTQASTNANSHGGSTPHLDLWSDGRTSSQSNAHSCMAHVTATGVLVIQNPASNYVVVAGPLAANNSCRTIYGNSPVTAG
jgi:uncharacterized protein YkwD